MKTRRQRAEEAAAQRKWCLREELSLNALHAGSEYLKGKVLAEQDKHRFIGIKEGNRKI